MVASKTLGKKLREIRKKNDMTLYELGEKVSVSESLVSRYEKGIVEISIDKLLMFCNIFKVSPNEFLDWKVSPIEFLDWKEINTRIGEYEGDDKNNIFENSLFEWHEQIKNELVEKPFDMNLLCINAVLEKVEELYKK